MEAFKKKLYDAIFDYLNESMTDDKADEQSINIVNEIVELDKEILTMITKETNDLGLLSKKFHTLKNLLLYGDFYYESDLCQDIEEKLRETRNLNSIMMLNNELQSTLKM